MRRKRLNVLFFISILLNTQVVLAYNKNDKHKKEKYAKVIVDINSAERNDSLVLKIYDYYFNERTEAYSSYRSYTATSNSGRFVFLIPEMNDVSYMSLEAREDAGIRSGRMAPFLDYYLLESGDSIYIKMVEGKNQNHSDVIKAGIGLESTYKYKNYHYYFSGQGSGKLKCRYEADTSIAWSIPEVPVFSKTLKYNEANYMTSDLGKALFVIKKYRKEISEMVYNLMKADFIGRIKTKEYQYVYNATFSSYAKPGIDLKIKKEICRRYFYRDLYNSFDEHIERLSFYYPGFVSIKKRMQAAIRNSKESFVSTLSNIRNIALRDRVLTAYLLENHKRIDKNDSVFRAIIPTISNSYCRDELMYLYNSIRKGSKGYVFELSDIEGNRIKLSDFLGKVVLIDFWFTGCGACRNYYINHLSKAEEKFKNNSDVAFITISVDVSKSVWIKSINEQKYASHNSINLYTEGLGSNHPVIEHYKVFGYPRPILIDRRGMIYSASDSELRRYESLIISINKALEKTE